MVISDYPRSWTPATPTDTKAFQVRCRPLGESGEDGNGEGYRGGFWV